MDQYGFLGKGFHFPVEPDSATGRFLMEEGEEKISQAIRIILMTRKGERVMRPEFGCDIYQYMFGVMDFTTLSMMEQSVRDALIRWEPRIRDLEIHAEAFNGEPAGVHLSVGYRVRATNNPYNLVFPFYLEEGIMPE